MDTLNSDGGSDSQNTAVKGAALLLVIGEPFSEEHKKLILGEISQGGSFFHFPNLFRRCRQFSPL